MTNTTDDKKRRLHKARRSFEQSGNRFFGRSFSDGGFDFDASGVWAELTVLTALLTAYRDERCTSIFYDVVDPRSPVHQGGDLLVATPEIGAVLIEVKSHRLKDLSWRDRTGICVQYGREQKGILPQVKRAHKYLVDMLSAEAKKLKQLLPPVSFLVALPNVSKADFLSDPIARNAWPEAHIAFQEDLAPSRLHKIAREAAELGARRMGKLPATVTQMELVDSVLGGLPNGLRLSARGRPVGCVGEEIDRIHDSNCLRPDQRGITLRALSGRPTVLRGVAGSGKSILLAKSLVRMVELHLAKRGEDREPLRVLVTCFNRTLVPLLKRDTLSFAKQRHIELDAADVSFIHFEGVLTKLRNEWKLPIRRFSEAEDDIRIPEALRLVDELFDDDPELEESFLYDFVFADEAQDLDPQAFRLLQRLAKRDEKTGERGIAIFYDDAQNLYGRKRPIWKDLGINVSGRRTVAMTECRRTSRSIATFAFNVLLGAALPDGQRARTREYANVASLEKNELVYETDDGLVVEFAQRPGRAPEVWRLEDQEAELEAIVTTVMDLITGERVAPEEILIQTDNKVKTLNPLVEAFERLAHAPSCHVATRSRDELIVKEGSVTLSTIHSAKGYDAPIVFIMNAQGFEQDPESRARFYVGATRAQLQLYVTAHGEEDGGLLTEMEEVRRRLPLIGGGGR